MIQSTESSMALPSTSVNPGRSYFDFQMEDLLQSTLFSSPSTNTSSSSSSSSPPTSTFLNKLPLYCPNPSCKCLLLKPLKGSQSLESRNPSFQLPSYSLSPSKVLPASSFYWFLEDMWAFENIAFSHTTSMESIPIETNEKGLELKKEVPEGNGNMKYLACADCDLGPLGYQNLTRPKEFWLAADRVRYGPLTQ